MTADLTRAGYYSRDSRLFVYGDTIMPIYFWVGLLAGLFSPVLSLAEAAIMPKYGVKSATATLILGEFVGWPLVILGALVRWLG